MSPEQQLCVCEALYVAALAHSCPPDFLADLLTQAIREFPPCVRRASKARVLRNIESYSRQSGEPVNVQLLALEMLP